MYSLWAGLNRMTEGRQDDNVTYVAVVVMLSVCVQWYLHMHPLVKVCHSVPEPTSS